MKTVAIIGANGQLGSDLAEHWRVRGYGVAALTHEDIRVENVDSVKEALGASRADVVLNTAAYHNVPKCEADPQQSYLVNGVGALNVARVAEDLGMTNVYFSTDYVFDGSKHAPYVETDLPNPVNVYASTKLLGEYYTMNYCSRGYVIRVSGIYGRVPCRAKGGNFVLTMLRAAREKPEVRVVTDEVLTPTPTSAIAAGTLPIVERGETGCYHMTCEGECSWYEFAAVIFATMRFRTPLLKASVRDFPSPVRRPFYSVLENSRAKQQGLANMPHWKDSLIHFLRQHHGA